MQRACQLSHKIKKKLKFMSLNRKKKLQYLAPKAILCVRHLIIKNKLLLVDAEIIQ